MYIFYQKKERKKKEIETASLASEYLKLPNSLRNKHDLEMEPVTNNTSKDVISEEAWFRRNDTM